MTQICVEMAGRLASSRLVDRTRSSDAKLYEWFCAHCTCRFVCVMIAVLRKPMLKLAAGAALSAVHVTSGRGRPADSRPAG